MFRSVTDRTHGILHTIFFLSDQRLHYSEKYYSCGKSAESYQHLSYLLCFDLSVAE